MMFLLEFPILHDKLFIGLALVLSTILGIRGIAIHINVSKDENARLRGEQKAEWKTWQVILVYYVADFIFNFVGSLAGWIALYMLSYRLFTCTGPCPLPPSNYLLDRPNLHLLGWPELALAVLALLGITGRLPETMQNFIGSIAEAVKSLTGKLAKS